MLQHLNLDYYWPTEKELWGKGSRKSVFAKTDLSFCLENMDQKNLAGWTLIHLFPVPASKQT